MLLQMIIGLESADFGWNFVGSKLVKCWEDLKSLVLKLRKFLSPSKNYESMKKKIVQNL